MPAIYSSQIVAKIVLPIGTIRKAHTDFEAIHKTHTDFEMKGFSSSFLSPIVNKIPDLTKFRTHDTSKIMILSQHLKLAIQIVPERGRGVC